MIRISQQDNAAAAKSYYSTADYYSEGQEIVGSWGGKGASRLGLEGAVDRLSFERLCDNIDPKTGKQLTVRTRTERTVGYDFTFSVPKSVSLLYAISGDQSILDAFRASVDETMREMEAEMKTRVRRKGADIDRTTGNMAWAEFIHTTSRPVDGIPDPQLHAHVFVFNTTWDKEESRWKAGQFKEVKRDAPYFQAAFRVRLANRLQDMGFGAVRKRDDFEIAGIDKDVLKRFSRRTELIEKVAAEKGITNPDRKAELGAETREGKMATLSWKQLKREWRSRLSDGEWSSLQGVYRRECRHARQRGGEAPAVDYALEHSFVREAVVPERKLLTEALKRGLGAVTVASVGSEMQKRPLIRSVVDGRDLATTQEMLACEERMINFAREGRGRCLPLGDPERACARQQFTAGQKAAVRHVLESRDRVMIIRGGAGTGKTSLEQEIGEAMAEAGKPVVALAQSVKASREVLRNEAGFANADTVARFLRDAKMQEAARGGIILVDEASQLGTRDMLQVFHVAEKLGSRVLLVGDRKQHRSVTAGEPLRLLEQSAGLKTADVTEVVRQRGRYKEVSEALSDGKVAKAFKELHEMGWIRQVPDAERYQQLADAYVTAIAEKKKGGKQKTALVVSPTHAEGDRITRAIREALKAQGKIGKERIVHAWMPGHLTDAEKADPTQYEPGNLIQFHQNAPGGYSKGSRVIVGEGSIVPKEHANRFELYRPVELAFAKGDRVRVTAGGKTKDGKHRLNNGALLTVKGFTAGGDIVVDHGWVIGKEFGHLAHGYAVTSHASQGVTVDKVFAGISSESFPATSQRSAYVALTRGREQVVLFTDDTKELLKAASRADEPMSATELSQSAQVSTKGRARRMKTLAMGLGRAGFGPGLEAAKSAAQQKPADRGLDHDR